MDDLRDLCELCGEHAHGVEWRCTSIALVTSSGEVEYDLKLINREDIIEAIEDAGFDASLMSSGQSEKVKFVVVGMYSFVEKAIVDSILRLLQREKDASIDPLSDKVEVLMDPEVIGLRAILEAVEANGDFNLVILNQYTNKSPKYTNNLMCVYKIHS